MTDALDYDKLKDAWLQRFEMTEEGFRRRFRSGRPEKAKLSYSMSVGLGIIYRGGYNWQRLKRLMMT